MATIGRGSAVADMGWLQFSGYPAWLAWLFIHLMNLVEFENRVLVLVQWGWSYVTWNRGARLITDLGRALGLNADGGALRRGRKAASYRDRNLILVQERPAGGTPAAKGRSDQEQ